MKKTLQEEKQRILQLMCRINEQAFNDDGEPLMTHNQYRDYSEPSDPEYDNNGHDGYEREQTKEDIVKGLENDFNTILEPYEDEYTFLTTVGTDGDIMIWFTENNQVGGVCPDGEKFDEEDIEDVNIDDLIKFFEPYRNQILNTEEAEKELNRRSDERARDWEYEKQERAATGAGGF